MAEPYDPCECIVDGFARKRAYGTIQTLKPKAKALLSLYMRGVRMKSTGLLKVVCTAALAASCCFGLAACSQDGQSQTGSGIDVSDVSGGVAAKVNGAEIGENAVTAYVANFRNSNGLADDTAWAQWMVDNGFTASDVRSQVIDYYVSQELIRQAASENGVTVDSSEVDGQISTMRSYYSSDEEWNAALEAVGTTEDQYRDMIELSLTETGLKDKVATATEPTDEEMLQYARMYASAYDGAKKSSHILFASDDQATAQEVLDKINSGELDFADAAQQYSQDEGSKADGGNVGWDKLTSFVDEYQTALDGLEKDQVSALVTSTYGIHIIKCTDVFTAPDEVTSIDQIPSEFSDSIKQSLEASSKNQSYSDWYQSYKESAEIETTDMPSGLAYDVSIDGIEPSEGSTAAATQDEGVSEGEESTGEGSSSAEGQGEAASEEPAAEASSSESEQIPEATPAS